MREKGKYKQWVSKSTKTRHTSRQVEPRERKLEVKETQTYKFLGVLIISDGKIVTKIVNRAKKCTRLNYIIV